MLVNRYRQSLNIWAKTMVGDMQTQYALCVERQGTAVMRISTIERVSKRYEVRLDLVLQCNMPGRVVPARHRLPDHQPGILNAGVGTSELLSHSGVRCVCQSLMNCGQCCSIYNNKPSTT